MNRVALLIGGNQSDRHALIEQATALIQKRIGTVALVSGIYETEPWGDFGVENGGERVENFLNRALLVETTMTAFEVLHEALAIEADLGRVRTNNSQLSILNSQFRTYHSRPMDIDLIFFWRADGSAEKDEIIDTEELTLPHPRAHLRRFVLEPLAEIIPNHRHPILGKTVLELLHDVPTAEQ